MNLPSNRIWLAQPSPPERTSRLLSLPKELLFDILACVATLHDPSILYPPALIQLSLTCRHLHRLIHQDPCRLAMLWPRAFSARFDTQAIYRRQLHRHINWQTLFERRSRALHACYHTAAQLLRHPDLDISARLNAIDWEAIWDMLTEHDERNVPQLLKCRVHLTAGAAFQLGRFRDRKVYPAVLPILSLLVNYEFSITQFFTSVAPQVVAQELSQFAYDFESDALITKHMPTRLIRSWASEAADDSDSDVSVSVFCPAQDPITSAQHLFFTTVFACHPAPYQAIPGCIPIPLFPIASHMFDVEFLRRYERNLFLASLQESRLGWKEAKSSGSVTQQPSLPNIYSETGFGSTSHFVSEAHLIEGDWIGYYSFLDPDDVSPATDDAPATQSEDWFDGPMRLSLRIVSSQGNADVTDPSWRSRWASFSQSTPPTQSGAFPSNHLSTFPLTRFEGSGVDNLGQFNVSGLIDDTEDGQVTWEKTYVDSEETWEYTGRFIPPMGLCGRWGDEQYGGPWWIWKSARNEIEARNEDASETRDDQHADALATLSAVALK